MKSAYVLIHHYYVGSHLKFKASWVVTDDLYQVMKEIEEQIHQESPGAYGVSQIVEKVNQDVIDAIKEYC